MHLVPALTSAQVVGLLGLGSHPEGGFFRETFRTTRQVQTPRGPRSLATGILFLLTEGSRSRFHRLQSEELWVHQAGAPVELIMLPIADSDAGRLEVVTLATPDPPLGGGLRPAGVCEPQAAVPAGVWQAARVVPTSATSGWGLAACIVSPGFDYADFELAERDALVREFPQHTDLISQLT
jgi:uncharacterized protein